MSTILNVGPDGMIVIEAVIVSLVLAVMAWRRAALPAAGIVTALCAAVLPVWWETAEPSTFNHRVALAVFVLVPTAILLGASRVRWMSRHAWVLLLVGPILFIGCFVGVCELCARAGLLS
jgi:hypothetical protein